MDKVVASVLFSFVLAAQTCDTYSFTNNQRYSTCNDLPVLTSFLHWTYDSSTTLFILHSVALEPPHPNGRLELSTLQDNEWEGLNAWWHCKLPVEFGTNCYLLSTNQLWQVGPMNGNSPGVHVTTGDNMRSTATIDFTTGQTISTSVNFDARQRKRNVHGVINAASAYIFGVAGWATGIKLGNENSINDNQIHRNIGIGPFRPCNTSEFALLLRPKPDHKYRFYWNIYHHSIGYAVIGMSIYNVLSGLSILDPERKWWNLYLAILVVLGVTAAFLEAITWYIVIQRKRKNNQKNSHNANGVKGANGANGANGYCVRTEQEV
ncbi:hypothetical protein Patl1_01875 [Pistacia atlantica]|uniref:Uncharacterized protein n=1 Tax=Pistacia atlantica TaxID=434234 RepID=A0ACC1CAP7_9ROSI|nr:hypothetical protein Patl1_01875 [Pistacia atlantica]